MSAAELPHRPPSLAGSGVAFGLQLPIQTLTRTLADPWEAAATVDDLVAVATRAEQVGFDFIGVCDHVAVPNNHDARNMTTTWYDTVTTLAFLAAHTTRIRLVSTVFIAAYRHPLVTAKMWSTLDHLSGGRAILGVGVGHVEAEFDALGIDFAARGAVLDETLAALTGAFVDPYVSHHGERFDYVDVGVGPPPPSGALTIWVAGGGPAALRRVGQYGHGFIPFLNAPESYPSIVATIHDWADRSGRADVDFDIGIMPPWMYVGEAPADIGPHQLSGSADHIAAELVRESQLGANVFHLKLRGRSLSEYLDQIDGFGHTVMPLVREGAQ